MSNCIRTVFKIHGHVQGVGFRYFVYRKAIEMKLHGYVKNLVDGSVECMVESDYDTIEKFRAILLQGSSRSHVTDVEIFKSECSNTHDTFVII